MARFSANVVSASDATREILLKAEDTRTVRLVERDTRPVEIRKTWSLTPGQIGRYLLGISQCQRQVRGYHRAKSAGLNSPTVLETRMAAGDRWPGELELRLEYMPGETLDRLQMRFAESPGWQKRIAARIGEIIATLADAGFRHRDFKLDNLVLADSDCGGTFPDQIWLIDTVGIKRSLSPVRAVWQMLHRLTFLWDRDCSIEPAAMIALVRAATRRLTRRQTRVVLNRLRTSDIHRTRFRNGYAGTRQTGYGCLRAA